MPDGIDVGLEEISGLGDYPGNLWPIQSPPGRVVRAQTAPIGQSLLPNLLAG